MFICCLAKKKKTFFAIIKSEMLFLVLGIMKQQFPQEYLSREKNKGKHDKNNCSNNLSHVQTHKCVYWGGTKIGVERKKKIIMVLLKYDFGASNSSLKANPMKIKKKIISLIWSKTKKLTNWSKLAGTNSPPNNIGRQPGSLK